MERRATDGSEHEEPELSVLFPRRGPGTVEHAGDGPRDAASEPAYFHDLNLDQVRDALFAGFDASALVPHFHRRLEDPAAVAYRHEVFRDLDGRPLLDAIESFAGAMADVASGLAHAASLSQSQQGARWRLDAADAYIGAVDGLGRALDAAEPRSRALDALGAKVRGYLASTEFVRLREECNSVLEQLAGVCYGLQLKGLRVAVRPYLGEADYSEEVVATFERFRQGAVHDYRLALRDWKVLDDVEARILERVATLFPEQFGALHAFSRAWADFVDPTLRAFAEEVRFYVAYLRWMAPMRAAGLPWCYPEVCGNGSRTHASDAYDAALAQHLVTDGSPVVTNDVELRGDERILVVTGPNQGGKTTFARAFGQLHHLAAIGCPVPAADAAIALSDGIFTHFEREEDLAATGGKLEDELVRVRDVVLRATARSVLVFNEVFTSTTLADATFLGRKVLERVAALGARCVYVTFVDELASLSPATVSMVGAVDPGDPSVRTFEVLRRPADGRSYALAVAEKHGLTYDQLRRRIGAPAADAPTRR